jgi:diaminopimelate decarboxylase
VSAPRHAERRFFHASGAELMIGDVPVSDLASRVGTPFYAYSGAAMNVRVAELRAVLPEAIKLHYAIKANPMPDVVRFMSPLVDGLDVASGRELRVALDAGMRPQDISFAGPGKSVAELEQAVTAGILVNVESFREIALLESIQQRSGKPARVAVRVNPDFELKSSGMKMGGGPKQFGIDAELVPQALRQIAAGALAFEGFHIFSGSQNLKVASICEALSKVLALATRLAEAAPSPLKVLNLGGGFGIPYFPGETALDLVPIGAHLREIAAQANAGMPGMELVIELGRFLVGEAGVYVCRVVDRKVSRGEVFLVTDGGLHHHLAASGNFGQVIRKNYPVAIANRMDAQETERASVVGPLCTPLDVLADRMPLAHAIEGDLVAVFQSGAYGYTASPHAFLSHPPPREEFL